MNADFNTALILSYLLTYWNTKRQMTWVNQTTNRARTDHTQHWAMLSQSIRSATAVRILYATD